MHTENQLLVEYTTVMGPDLAQWYYELEQEVDWLQLKWSAFRDLYDKGAERIGMLNRVAPNFFHILHRFLFEDAMLHLCRLTDPSKTFGRHENLTMMRLSERLSDGRLKMSVSTAADQVRHKCDFARDWRDKRLAHTDLQVFRTGSASLPDVKSKNIEEAISSMCALLNLVRDHYGIPPAAFLSSDPYGAEALLHYLERGIKAEQDEEQSLS